MLKFCVYDLLVDIVAFICLIEIYYNIVRRVVVLKSKITSIQVYRVLLQFFARIIVSLVSFWPLLFLLLFNFVNIEVWLHRNVMNCLSFIVLLVLLFIVLLLFQLHSCLYSQEYSSEVLYYSFLFAILYQPFDHFLKLNCLSFDIFLVLTYTFPDC